MKNFILFSRIFAILTVLLILSYVLVANTTPINISRTYIGDNKNVFTLGPKNRVETTYGINKQLYDLVYFNSKMPFSFDQARTKVTFKNPSQQQKIYLGYKDQVSWHYNTQVIDDPLMDNLTWSKIGSGPYLYQKTSTYKSINDFFKSPPKQKIIGITDFKDTDSFQSKITIPNYQPSNTNTQIDVPFRGKTTIYVYLNNEPFNIDFTKRDLNWYEDPDVTKITVYKGRDDVFDATIDDDGNTSSNLRAGPPQSINIKNPGPGLPENGVYKIVIDNTGDSLITNITTKLHKIAFAGPLYVADNHEIYGDIVKKTNSTLLTTNAPRVSFKTDHSQSKVVILDKQIIHIDSSGKEFIFPNTKPTAAIAIPQSDMILNGSGYFSLRPDQFFAPTPYNLLPINSAEDINQAEFILTNYKPPTHDSGWLVAERDFNLINPFINKRQLNWVLETPGLKENNRTVEYKKIQMTLSKKGWFKK
jgi:hypothetical protein